MRIQQALEGEFAKFSKQGAKIAARAQDPFASGRYLNIDTGELYGSIFSRPLGDNRGFQVGTHAFHGIGWEVGWPAFKASGYSESQFQNLVFDEISELETAPSERQRPVIAAAHEELHKEIFNELQEGIQDAMDASFQDYLIPIG